MGLRSAAAALAAHRVARPVLWAAPATRCFSSSLENDVVTLEKKESVALITLNRPKSLNALNDELVSAIIATLQQADADPELRAAVLTGSGKAFAAGADIKEMGSRRDYATVRREHMLVHWNE